MVWNLGWEWRWRRPWGPGCGGDGVPLSVPPLQCPQGFWWLLLLPREGWVQEGDQCHSPKSAGHPGECGQDEMPPPQGVQPSRRLVRSAGAQGRMGQGELWVWPQWLWVWPQWLCAPGLTESSAGHWTLQFTDGALCPERVRDSRPQSSHSRIPQGPLHGGWVARGSPGKLRFKPQAPTNLLRDLGRSHPTEWRPWEGQLLGPAPEG